MNTPKPVVLCILDGWGLSDVLEGNAPAQAKTPVMDHIMATCPNATLTTHGPDVGLPSGQMGNSEVGHTNIGAGRVVAMDLGQIDLAIEDSSFFNNTAILDFARKLQSSAGTAHLIGLTSKGGVHAHQDHMLAAAKLLTDQGVPVAVHVITDGRDVAPTQAFHDIYEVEKSLPEGAYIATVSGRYFALDRDNRWARVEKAWRTMVLADGDVLQGAQEGIATSYDLDQTDEFVEPFVVEGYKGMQDGDGVFFLNFRADRARELLSAIGDPAFDAFDVTRRPKLSALLGMVNYSEAHDAFMTTAFPKQDIANTLGAWVAQHGKTQFRLAETEKYPHVTFFLNGGAEAPAKGEERHMPKSPDVATYDMQPEMSAPDVTDRFVQAIEEGYDLIVTNYANPDMVGHTGDLQAAIQACEAVDTGLGRVMKALNAAGGAMIICADHGNCETMIDPETGGPHTAHTLNPVPVAVVGMGDVTLTSGKLGDLAPTLLHMMGMETPPEMTGNCLIS